MTIGSVCFHPFNTKEMLRVQKVGCNDPEKTIRSERAKGNESPHGG